MCSSMKPLVFAGLLLGFLAAGCQQPKPPDEMQVTTNSQEARDLYNRAVTLAENGTLPASRQLFRQAIQKDPDFAAAYAWLGALGNDPESIKNLDKALSLLDKVSPAERQFILFMSKAAGGNQAEGLPMIDSLLAAFPRDKHLHLYAGEAYITLKDRAKGEEHFDAALKIDSTYGAAYNLAGYGRMAMGDMAAAEKALQRYIAVEPALANPHDSYGEFLLTDGRYDESAVEYLKAFAMDSTFVGSLRGAGDAYLKKGDAGKALEQYSAYEAKASTVPEKLGALRRTAEAYVIGGDISGALNTLDKYKTLALKQNLNERAVDAAGYVPYILVALGNPAEGIRKYDEFLKMVRTIPLADSIRASRLKWEMVHKAYMYLEARNPAKAKAALVLVRKNFDRTRDPEIEPWLKALQGSLSLQEGKVDQAIDILSHLPQEPFTLHALSLALAKKGEKEKLATVLNKLNRQPVSLNWAVENRQAATAHGI